MRIYVCLNIQKKTRSYKCEVRICVQFVYRENLFENQYLVLYNIFLSISLIYKLNIFCFKYSLHIKRILT